MSQRALAENRLPNEAFASEGVIESTTGGSHELLVIVRFTGGAVAPLEATGLNIITRLDDMVTGQIAATSLESLAALDSVIRIEGDYPYEPLLDVSVSEVNADNVNSAPGVGTPPQVYNGSGVILGIIDSGIDFQHPAFLRPDGTSRILAIWDQDLNVTGTETTPQSHNFGVEYNRTAINSALGSANPGTSVRHQCSGTGHGNHVASIAGGSSPHFPGIATGADFIIVKPKGLSSLTTIPAMDYIYNMADTLDRPCVINQSQGINAGPHDGSMEIERYIDKLLGRPGRSYIVAAGNFATDNIHWGQSLASSASVTMTFTVEAVTSVANRPRFGKVEVWYPQNGQLSVSVTNPGGVLKGPHTQPTSGNANHPESFSSGTSLDIGLISNIPFNRKNQMLLNFQNFSAAGIDPGNWTITLTNTGTTPVEFHSWIERNNGSMHFQGFPNSAPYTGSTPGTAREVISVGSYVTKPSSGSGVISPFSSQGPTVDGRIKPDISAPGQLIKAARSQHTTDPRLGPETPGGQYVTMQGTSMAAPHVAGAVACLFERRPTLTQEQIRRGLATTARSDSHTGTGNNVPNNIFGAGKLDTQALLNYSFPASETQTWVRIRSALYNWTEGDRPPTFEVFSNENGRAIIELAFGSTDIPTAPERDPAAPLRYYNTAETLTALSITNANGSTRTLNLTEQQIILTGNHASWTMPQALWDAYREELKKSRLSPSQSQMAQMLYYRVRFEPTGGTSAILWPEDASFNASPLNNRMNIIALRSDPLTQVMPDRPAILAMPSHAAQLEWLWQHLPESDPDRASLVSIFSHRFFTNHVETEIRGKVLSLWVQAGPARQRLFTLLDRMFTTATGLEMTVLKQPCIKDNIMLIDHLLELVDIDPHPDIAGVRVAEHMVDDVLQEILDPNGQVNQGRASTCAPTAIMTMLLLSNAAEFVRLQRGFLSVGQQATLANGDVVNPPPGIFRAALYAGDQSSPFYVRTNSELAFQATILKYAKGRSFPRYNPDAPPNSARGINTVFQATIGRGLSFAEIKTTLDGLFNSNFTKNEAAQPTAALRNSFVTDIQASSAPLLTVLHWQKPHTDPNTGLHAVVSMRHEASRTFFKNPQYSGSHPPAAMVANGTAQNPPRRTDDPTQTLESMGDDDLSNWVRAYYKSA